MAEDFAGPVRVTGDGRQTIVDGADLYVGRRMPVGGGGTGPGGIVHGGEVIVEDQVFIDADAAVDAGPSARLVVGDLGITGAVQLVDKEGKTTVSLGGGFGTFGTGKQVGGITVRGARNGPVILVTGKDGRITFLNARLEKRLTIDGEAGDIEFSGSDCAEDFDVVGDAAAGSVMCLDDNGALRSCSRSYDTRVVGVVSGAGSWRPALRLNHQETSTRTLPVALVGRVFCLAEAESQPIGLGDLLTTSATPGHAMRASDPKRAFGAVLGKSMGSLPRGRDLLPVLVALQ